MEIKGVIPPLITPFDKNGEVYEEGLRRLLDFQVEKGSHGVFLCGTYGLGPIMTVEQRKRVLEIAVDQVGGKMAIIAHVGAASTNEVIELAKHAEDNGADAVAAVPPYYYRHDDETVVEHYRQLVNSVNLPVYAYNNPKTSGFTITPSVLVKLADVGVKGLKDSGFNLVEFSHFVLEVGSRDFNLIIGTEALLLPAVMLGANGCVSGLANAFPEVVVDLYNATVNKNYDEAVKLQLKVNEARRILHIAKSTAAACYAMLQERGVDVGVPRRPVLPVTEEERKRMKEEFVRLGLLGE